MKSKKKIISILMALLMAIPFVFASSANILGDVDGDKDITPSDARLALRASVNLENFAPGSAEFLACDVDLDGYVTASDARLILRASVGLETLGTTADPEKIWGYDANSTVYVSNRSNTIHRVSDCSGMKNYREMTLAQAVSHDYAKCKNCW